MELRFDFATDDKSAGFRLAFFEAYNWGTYNNHIVRLDLSGNNGLLTGDIGSGKSTIVDALTTLLVPHQKIIYNKAAGANTKERTLYSYILGEYKSSQDENFSTSKAVGLRDTSSYTVLLARFENEGFDESFTIAQFFYIANNQVNKFFVTSESDIDIAKNFSNFSDIRVLKKQLRDTPHTKVFEQFKDYSKDFTRVMGIKNEQALNLFYQTVSLKSIGNLTEFIRMHMLQSNDIDKDIEQLCSNFADLNHTHELIIRAKRQIELLEPIRTDAKLYHNTKEKLQDLTKMGESIGLYFARYKKELLESKLIELNIELTKNNSAKVLTDKELSGLNEQIINLKIDLQKNGGDRINQIESEITQASHFMQSAKKENDNFNNIVKSLGFGAVSNEHRFLHTLSEIDSEYKSIDGQITTLENKIMFDKNTTQRYKDDAIELEAEIAYLENHPSNIPQKISRIRDDMAMALGLKKDELPFVGELISVADEEWYGAIERVLHNFALSLIVDSALYDKVSDYVENTNLRGKLIYLKVDSSKKTDLFTNTIPNSLLEKLELRVDSKYFEWLNSSLSEKFNISCVENMGEFRRYKKALSINGQFKSNLSRHEKDDRFDINDSSRWVLGWDNLVKLEKFKTDLEHLKQKIAHIDKQLQINENSKKEIQQKRDNLRDAKKYESFETINWYRYSKQIERLDAEKEELEKSNDIIKSLQKSIDNLLQDEIVKKGKSESLTKRITLIENDIEIRQEELNGAVLLLQNNTLSDELKDKIDGLKEQLMLSSFTLNNINSSQNQIREKIDKDYKKNLDKQASLTTAIQKNMNEYIRQFQVESKEFDSSIESIKEFTARLDKLKKDNLPKWQKKFKELLKEKTIQGIVILQSTLEEQAKDIQKKITNINQSLKDIEYSDGTYIELLASKSNIAEIKEFKQKLKSVTIGSINEDNSYDEHKFLQIKELIDRFNAREGYVDVDRRWRKTVTDVRNWFDFSASERYISDGVQKEFYAHSGGKSGGQKEKLAYTVLASSLAYQFGLEYEKIQSRSFRFVMIDEAFGRGSDESTRYALRLFEKLKLQLLVITPKQKINIIEPFVSSVHFVHNQDGMDSTLISMKIEEYIKRKTADE